MACEILPVSCISILGLFFPSGGHFGSEVVIGSELPVTHSANAANQLANEPANHLRHPLHNGRCLAHRCRHMTSCRYITIVDLFMEKIWIDDEIIMKIKKSLFNPVNLYDDINDLDMMDQMDGF